MEVHHLRVCGLDVHKQKVVACVRVVLGTTTTRVVRTFDAHRRGLTALRTWLLEEQVQEVGMEGTGIYWRPVYAVLEDAAPWKLTVGNAQHIKNVPGRKTDVKDSEWIAELLAYQFIKPSFIPPPELRNLRDLTRNRSAWIADRARDRNRVLKILQLAGIKLDGVASDAFGKSGMAILHALCTGDATPEAMANLAKGLLRKKIDALTLALESPLAPTHREMLGLALKRLEQTEQLLAEYDVLIDKMLAPYKEQLNHLVTIPGVDRIVAATIIAELGPDMSVFPTPAHAASWAGLSPGNHETGGKRSRVPTTKGNPALKTMLCQAAQSAARTRHGYLRDKFYRLKARRGHNRAVMAIAHKLLVYAYSMLKDGTDYRDLGDNYLDHRDKTRVVRQLVGRLNSLGMDVTITPRTGTEAISASA